MTQATASGRYEGILHQDILSEGDERLPSSYGTADAPSGLNAGRTNPFVELTSPAAAPSGLSGIGTSNAGSNASRGFGTGSGASNSGSNASKGSGTGTGVPSARYHTLLYDLLTWQNPRASAVSLAVLVLPILVGRFVNVLRFVLLGTWTLLSISMSIEFGGRKILGQGDGTAKGLRPRKYYTVTKDMIDPYFEEFHNLLNFGLVEFQRILFVESPKVTFGAVCCSLLAYEMVKVLPAWALAALSISMAYALPPLYVQYQEPIDAQLTRAQTMADENLGYAKELASKHAGDVVDRATQYFQKSKESTRTGLGLSPAGENVGEGGAATSTDPMLEPAAAVEPMAQRGSMPPVYSTTRVDLTSLPEVPKAQPEIGSRPMDIRDLDAELDAARTKASILE